MKITNYGELRPYQLGKVKMWRIGELLEVNRRLHFTTHHEEKENGSTHTEGEYRKVNVIARVIAHTDIMGCKYPDIAYRHPATSRIHVEMGIDGGFSMTENQFKELKKL